MSMDDVIQIITPAPDSQYLLLCCPACKGDGKEYPKIHPTQKPINVLKRLIEVFTDPGDVVIDPCCGSGSTIQAAYELGRNAYGFEVNKKFYEAAKAQMPCFQKDETIFGMV